MITGAIIRLTSASQNLGRKCDHRITSYREYCAKALVDRNGRISASKGDDPDKFGVYSQPRNQYELVKPDLKDELEEEEKEKKSSRPYDHDIKMTMQIKSLLKQRKVSEALGILDSGEISKPDGYVYGLLIKACGNVGYTKKAFKLYNQMKKRGINPRPSVYTSLFNACSNSPWKEDTLSRAEYLLQSLEDTGYEPNDINYNAMIKAFGRGGDITRAFSLVDQMVDRGIGVISSTFAFLLQACVSDKEAGFRHAILVWDKMLKNRISPTVYTYNLLLKCCKECGCGEGIDLNKLSASDSVLCIPGRNTLETFSMRNDILTLPVKLKEETPPSNPSSVSVKDMETKSSPETVCQQEGRPGRALENLEVDSNGVNNQNEAIIGVQNKLLNPASPQERLQALGGCVGFLKQMAKKGVRPNIKTFTQLLEVIPQTDSAEKELILALEQNGVEKDVEFCNMLMKNRARRFDYDGAKLVLPMMTAAGLAPNIMTFGILAMGCRNKDESKTFITQLKEAGFRLNAEIVGQLIRSACLRWEVFHVLELMELCIKDEIRPNARLLQHLNEFKDKIRKSVKQESSTDNIRGSKKLSAKAYEIYHLRLASWLKEVDLSEAEEQHPWAQFRRHYKQHKGDHSGMNIQ